MLPWGKHSAKGDRKFLLNSNIFGKNLDNVWQLDILGKIYHFMIYHWRRKKVLEKNYYSNRFCTIFKVLMTLF